MSTLIESPNKIVDIYAYRRFYEKFLELCNQLSEAERNAAYADRCLKDTYFLLRYVCDMPFMDHPYIYERCAFVDDIEFNRGGLDNWLFLWFREGFKSTIVNKGKNIQHILRNPEHSTLILSNTSDANKGAKMFLSTIKQEFQKNRKLQTLFPDILYANPEREADMWSLDRGLVVKRKTNRKEPTIFAAGLVDGQPTKVHCEWLCYDDVVTEDSVATQHMMEKTTKAMELSFALGQNVLGGGGKFFCGTRYDYADTYGTMIERGIYKVDLIPWHTGDNLTPRIHTKAKIEELKMSMSRYVFGCQLALNPIKSEEQQIDISAMQTYDKRHEEWDCVLLVDPAGEGKSKRNHDPDYTAICVVGRDYLGNMYLVDAVYDRIGIRDKIRIIFEMVAKYKVNKIWYEKVGMAGDLGALKNAQVDHGVYFGINEYIPQRFGEKKKRIVNTLEPLIRLGRLKFPAELYYYDTKGNRVNIMEMLKKEFSLMNKTEGHDDLADCLAQLGDVPIYGNPKQKSPDVPYVHKHRNPKMKEEKIHSPYTTYL
jgi:phage terminase large subunit-like protein